MKKKSKVIKHLKDDMKTFEKEKREDAQLLKALKTPKRKSKKK